MTQPVARKNIKKFKERKFVHGLKIHTSHGAKLQKSYEIILKALQKADLQII